MAGNLFNPKFTLRNDLNIAAGANATYVTSTVDTAWYNDAGRKYTYSKVGATQINGMTNDTWTEMININSAVPQALNVSHTMVMACNDASLVELHVKVTVDDVVVAQGSLDRTSTSASSSDPSFTINPFDGAIICKKLKVEIKRVGTFTHASASYAYGSVHVYSQGVM
jgi:hypothetical protein